MNDNPKPSDMPHKMVDDRYIREAANPRPTDKGHSFVRKPHLTQRPFVNNDLASLRRELTNQNLKGDRK